MPREEEKRLGFYEYRGMTIQGPSDNKSEPNPVWLLKDDDKGPFETRRTSLEPITDYCIISVSSWCADG